MKISISETINRHRRILSNISYLSILQVFNIVVPFITYPYLVRCVGLEIYGIVLTAQVLANYCSIIVDFGSNKVCARYVSIYRDNYDKLSEIVSSVFSIRLLLFIICFIFYSILIYLVPSYNQAWIIFILTYGYVLNELLFPQYFFQGIEQMKFITIVNVIIRTIFIVLVFIFIKTPQQAYLIPLFNSIGFLFGGIITYYILTLKFHIKIKFISWNISKKYFIDSSSLFATDLICTIKDKLNYLLVGQFAGMSNVVFYDLGSKINSLLCKPIEIISSTLFPVFSLQRDIRKFKKVTFFMFLLILSLTLIVNIFLPTIIKILLDTQITPLWPIRLFTMAPVILSISVMICVNFFIPWGYNKYVLYSIIVTTVAYLIGLLLIFLFNQINSYWAFILLAIIAYIVELIYRVFIFYKKNRSLNV